MDVSTTPAMEQWIAEWERFGSPESNANRFRRTADELVRYAVQDEMTGRRESASNEWEKINMLACAELRAEAKVRQVAS